MRGEALRSPADPHSHLVRHQRGDIGQRGHVGEGERRPAPTVRLAADDRQRGRALGAEREEDHDRQRDGHVEHRPIGAVPGDAMELLGPVPRCRARAPGPARHRRGTSRPAWPRRSRGPAARRSRRSRSASPSPAAARPARSPARRGPGSCRAVAVRWVARGSVRIVERGPNQDRDGQDQRAGAAEEHPAALGHAEQHRPRRRPLVAGQFHHERRRLAAQDRPLEQQATRARRPRSPAGTTPPASVPAGSAPPNGPTPNSKE